jgi:hypothetical protein
MRHLRHFIEDGSRCGYRVGGLGDGAADDEIAGSGGEGGGGRRDAFLIAGCAAGGADARDDKGRGGEAVTEGGDFFRACHEAADAGFGSSVSEVEDLLLGRVVDADGGELELIHAGEDGDSQELWRMGETGGGFDGGFEHGAATCGVDGEEFGSNGGC